MYDFSVDRENETKSTGQVESIPRVESLTNGGRNLSADSPAAAPEIASPPANALPQLKARPSTANSAPTSVMPTSDGSVDPSNSSGESFEEASLGAWFHGKPTVRHDGVEVSGVQEGGPVEDVGIKPGDIILAIAEHYVFTIQELHSELSSHPRGSRVIIRYRRNALIYDNLITLGSFRP